MSLPVEFDDCAGNEDVKFEVSDPDFLVNEDLNLVPQRDVRYSSPVLFIYGLSAHADDMAQVEITGLPVQSPHTLRVSIHCCWFVCEPLTIVSIYTSSTQKRLHFIKD